MGRVIRTGEAALCEDIKQSPFVIYDRERCRAGVRSLACLPLRIDGTPVGSFLCGTMTSGVIGADEMLLLEEVAANLSFALQYLDKQDAVRFLSYFEPLTGLAKRALFCERLSRLLQRGTDRLPRLEVAVFDIEHLSVINDSFGRHTGDRLLQCVSDRLKGHYPDTEQLAHLGGGTFVLVSALPERLEAECSHSASMISRDSLTDPSASMAATSPPGSRAASPAIQRTEKNPTSWCKTPKPPSRKRRSRASNICTTASR